MPLRWRSTARMRDMPDRPDCITSRGLRFPLDDQILSRRRRRVLRDGEYADRETAIVLRALEPADRVVEFGGGFGYLSTIAAAKLGLREYHVFEPNPRLADYIRATHAENGLTGLTTHQAAIGTRKTTGTLFVPGDDPLNGRMAAPDDMEGVTKVEDVEIRSVKTVLRELQPTALICDLNGQEGTVLNAADLGMVRCAIIKLHPRLSDRAGTATVFRAMAGGGLTYFPRTSDGRVVTFRRDW